MPDHPLRPLTDLPGVADAVARARAACEALRWHRALRRQWAVVRTEAGVRCARAGAVVDGIRVPLTVVRDVARGADDAASGPEGRAVVGALRVQAEVERLMRAPGATGVRGAMPFGQLAARLHALGVGEDVGDGVPGRPRSGGQPLDLRGLGPAPVAGELDARLAALGALAGAPLPREVPALVLSAVVHGEMLALRPFTQGNGVVARALFRHQVTTGGVDPVGVVVPEAVWAQEPNVYLSAAAGFATGSPEGVARWLRYCAESVTQGAAEGTAIADAVLAGSLTGAGGPAGG
ncbi:cell filamentation protein Fic [Actinotalea sp. K2]|uniref:cell filamentation protein Fic n=1 Tax=Actinotalea sp. K2 TaxID=2939438 RepID=UPI0020171F6F|nr:cell filamentation protein Fic [Actinotalea sp. K2]MCL3861366.1 cell filamentation protein Fic [Actinotalea sp. K2]